MATDPVCGMKVDEPRAAGSSEYQNQTYYFCSTGCKQKFDQNQPARCWSKNPVTDCFQVANKQKHPNEEQRS